MNRCNDTHAVLWDGKYTVAENDGLAALPGTGEDRRSQVPAAADLFGGAAWTEPAARPRRNGRQDVIVAGRTISHARHAEATVTTCGGEVWSAGAGTCQRHHRDRTDETGACHAVLCFRRRALLVLRGQLAFGDAHAAAAITAATASHGAVLSGNDVFVANASCVAGVFSGLSACIDRPWRTQMLASDGSGVYVLDGPTGDVLVFRHHEPPAPALLALLATAPRPSAALIAPPPAATTRNRPPVMLPPTIAAERLALGKASALAVVDGHVRRTFDDVVVVSPAPRAVASSVHGEYVPRALCAAPAQECPWHQYNNSGACAVRRWPPCRAIVVSTSDTTCAPAEPPPAHGHNVCVPAPTCPSGHARTHLGAVTSTCCPAPDCAGTYNHRDEVCHPPPTRRRRATERTPPTCPPLAAPTEAPNAPPSRGTPCQDGEYGPRCAPCGVCRAGQRLITPCTATAAVLCGDCPAGTWMDIHAHTLRHCKPGNGCPGVTTTHDGVCDSSHTSLARWWWIAIPLYGAAAQTAVEHRQTALP